MAWYNPVKADARTLINTFRKCFIKAQKSSFRRWLEANGCGGVPFAWLHSTGTNGTPTRLEGGKRRAGDAVKPARDGATAVNHAAMTWQSLADFPYIYPPIKSMLGGYRASSGNQLPSMVIITIKLSIINRSDSQWAVWLASPVPG